MKKIFKKTTFLILSLTLLSSAFLPVEVEGAATGYTDHVHVWAHTDNQSNDYGNSDCSGCRKVSGKTDCTKCIKSNKVPTGLIACTNSSCDSGKVTCSSCGGTGLVVDSKKNSTGDTDDGFSYKSYRFIVPCATCGGTLSSANNQGWYIVYSQANQISPHGYLHYIEDGYYVESNYSDGNLSAVIGTGIVTCSTCGGDDRVSCTTCGGDGTMGTTCSGCEGFGWNTFCTRSDCTYSKANDGWKYRKNKSYYNGVCYTTENTYTIAFNGNGASGGSTSNLSCKYDDSYTLTANGFYRTGYSFAGWNTASNGSGTSYANQASVSKLSATNGATVTLYAQWVPNVYSITLNNQSATSAGTTVYYQKYNTGKYTTSACSTAISSITVPTRNGYTFNGYYTGTNGSGTQYINASGVISAGTTTFTSNTTLYAFWSPNTYYITFDADGGVNAPGTQSFLFASGDKISTTTPSKTGYTFSHWYVVENGATMAPGATIPLEYGSFTLRAVWNANPYTLTLNPNYTGSTSTNVTVYYGSEYGTTLPTLSRDGYDFLGWYTSATGGTEVTSETIVNTAGAHSVYAHWEVQKFKLYFDVNGGQNLSIDTNYLEVPYGSSLPLTPTATKVGYAFVGWAYTADSETCIETGTMPNRDITVYAKYTLPVSGLKEAVIRIWSSTSIVEIPITTVQEGLDKTTYIADGINVLTSYTGSTAYGDFGIGAVVFDHAGNSSLWTWSKDTPPNPPEPLKYEQTVIHQFYHIANEQYQNIITLKEDVILNPLEDGSYETKTYTPTLLPVTIGGILYEMPSGYASKYAMEVGNYTIVNTTTGEYNVDGDYTTTIKYQPNVYKVTFNANGGAFANGSTTTTKDIAYTDFYGELPLDLTREGYEFDGWYTLPGDTTGTVKGEQIYSSSVYESTENVTLYAKWKVKSYKLIYNWTYNGGESVSGLTNNQTEFLIPYGSQVSITAIATKTNFMFYGWSKDDPNGKTNIVSSFTMPAQDIILYAQFYKDVTITFNDESGARTVAGRYWNNESGASITVPTIRTFGSWTSVGWIENNGLSSIEKDGGAYIFDSNKVYNAKFKKDITATFVVPDGVNPIDAISKTLSHTTGGIVPSFTITLPTPAERNQYSFVSWECSDGQVFKYAEKPSYGWTATFENSVVITGIWDKYPTLSVQDRYFTLADAKNGVITLEELLSTVIASDEEDGTLSINNGLDITDYNEYEFLELSAGASISVTYEAKDSFGNAVAKKGTVYIVNTVAKDTEISKEARFINLKYLLTSDSLKDEDGDGYLDGLGNTKNFGGLRATSLWKKNAVYANKLNNALTNETPVMSYTFTSEEIKKMKEYVENPNNGYANFVSENGRSNFIDLFFK